ncbi:MAG TPA: hypothetical protein PLV68_03935 [Ilumatobacteraceae bacterium]|nr:hypothetical protein [Ilumatobacteraceae bacterium]
MSLDTLSIRQPAVLRQSRDAGLVELAKSVLRDFDALPRRAQTFVYNTLVGERELGSHPISAAEWLSPRTDTATPALDSSSTIGRLHAIHQFLEAHVVVEDDWDMALMAVPAHVPAEWLAELETWSGDDAATFEIDWDS